MIVVLNTIFIPENRGLGNALNEAINNCSNSLIARMDSDDVSTKDRFSLQLEKFMCTPDLDVVGGNISEFIGSETNITGIRKVPETDWEIKRYVKRRCPLNHVSVMFKKSSVQKAGGYLDWYCNEDYYLWIRMIEKGFKFINIQKCLVNVRVGDSMSGRRGGYRYFESERGIQKYMYTHGMISHPRYLYNTFTRYVGEILLSDSLRTQAFRLLRKPYLEINNANINPRTVSHEEEYPPFSVAISVYGKDDAKWFDRAMESIVVEQTVKPNEIVLVVDGPITESIQVVIDKYTKLCNS